MAEFGHFVIRTLIVVGLGCSGISFIGYSFLKTLTGQAFEPLERLAGPISAALTLIGTGVTAASIYSPIVAPHTIVLLAPSAAPWHSSLPCLFGAP